MIYTYIACFSAAKCTLAVCGPVNGLRLVDSELPFYEPECHVEKPGMDLY